MIHFTTVRCPNCRMIYDFKLFGISTGIGPASAECYKCKTVFSTGRDEWPFSSKRQLLLFFVFSLICAGLGGLIAGNFIYAISEFRHGNPNPINAPFEDPFFQKASLMAAVVLLLLQVVRVRFSVLRAAAGQAPTRYHFFSPNLIFGTQAKTLCLLVASYYVGMVLWK